MPKIIDHEERRREIVKVAKRLILEGGFEAATMRSLAAEAGFANGALKHYFSGKESIIAATFESVLQEMAPEGWPKASDKRTPEEARQQLRQRVVRSMPLNEFSISAGRVLLVLWDHAVSNPDLAETYRAFFKNWHDSMSVLLGDALAYAPDGKAKDYEVLALEIMSITIGANVINLMHPDGRYIDVYRRMIDDFFARLWGEG